MREADPTKLPQARLGALLLASALLPQILRLPTALHPNLAAVIFAAAIAGAGRLTLGPARTRALPWRAWTTDAIRFATLCLVLGFVALLRLLPAPRDAAACAIGLATVALVPALAEEFVYRGLLGAVIAARYGATIAALATSLAFAVAHPLDRASAAPLALAAHAVAGLALFTLRPRGSLLVPMLAHAAYNATMRLAWEG